MIIFKVSTHADEECVRPDTDHQLKDVVSKDELLSDSYDIEEIENGAMLKVQASHISVGGEEIS